jgi:hypothetical protein
VTTHGAAIRASVVSLVCAAGNYARVREILIWSDYI